jgi:hypothetical protein
MLKSPLRLRDDDDYRRKDDQVWKLKERISQLLCTSEAQVVEPNNFTESETDKAWLLVRTFVQVLSISTSLFTRQNNLFINKKRNIYEGRHHFLSFL